MWLSFLLCVLFIDQSEVMTSIHGGGWAVSTTPPVRPLPQQAGEDEAARHLLTAMRRHTDGGARVLHRLWDRCQLQSLTINASNNSRICVEIPS